MNDCVINPIVACFTVGQKPDLITPLTDSTFGALVRCHMVGFLGERSKKHREETDYVGQLRLHRKGCLSTWEPGPLEEGSPSGLGPIQTRDNQQVSKISQESAGIIGLPAAFENPTPSLPTSGGTILSDRNPQPTRS